MAKKAAYTDISSGAKTVVVAAGAAAAAGPVPLLRGDVGLAGLEVPAPDGVEDGEAGDAAGEDGSNPCLQTSAKCCAALV